MKAIFALVFLAVLATAMAQYYGYGTYSHTPGAYVANYAYSAPAYGYSGAYAYPSHGYAYYK